MDVMTLLNAATAETIEQQWSSSFFGLDNDQRFVLLIIAIACATAIILALAGIITGTISTVHRRRLEAEMKQDMLDRGLPTEEIAKVIEATAPKDAMDRWIACWGKKK
jgi:hypothetical protein